MDRKKYLFSIFFILLCSCTQNHLAPFSDLKWKKQSRMPSRHKVIRGDTLYAIAFRYNKDYRQLAAYNRINIDSQLKEGQILKLYPVHPSSTYLPVSSKKEPTHQQLVRPNDKKFTHNASSYWYWPLKGTVKNAFMPHKGKKGIDIAGKKGDGIYAARSGVIAYAGNGLSGYGNLIIIKHDKTYLSAYAHNSRNLVHEGEYVKAYQKIADIGKIDKKYWGLHFEVRKNGEPVNPLTYLGTMHF